MIGILNMLGLAWVRWAVVAAVAGGLVASFAYSNQRKGAAKERAKIERAADVNARKADAARKSVSAVPADGLRDKYARD